MAKLVIGNNKTVGVPVITKEVEKLPALGLMLENSNGTLRHSTTETQIIDFTGVKKLEAFALSHAYYNNTAISGVVDMSDLEILDTSNGMDNMFRYCPNITEVKLDSLWRISGGFCMQYSFSSSGITKIEFPSLMVIDGSTAFDAACSQCTNLTTVKLDSLIHISGMNSCRQAFHTTGVTNVNFYSLKRVKNSAASGMFAYCSSLTTLSFPALQIIDTGAINGIITNVTGCTIHFPKNFDPQSGSTVISSLTSYPNFGGTNTVLAFDLPSTVVLTGANTTVYERNPKYDTATALAWRVQDGGTDYVPIVDWTPFYTSGTTDPQVNDTIYSDSACTTAVTTISSIS